MRNRLFIVTCSLLFLLGLIALLVGLYLWSSGQTNNSDNSIGVTPTLEPTGEVEVTREVEVTTKPDRTTDAVVGDKVAMQPTTKDQIFTGPYFTVNVPAGWAVVQRTGNRYAYFVTKNNYYIEINAADISGGGYGYPYNGVCETDEQRGGFTTSKFERVDNVFNLKNSNYSDFIFFGCLVDKSAQLGSKVWLGSRLVDPGSTMPGINPYKYFGKTQTEGSYVYFINYAHLSQGDIDSKYPVWDSIELSDTLRMLDKIAGSVIFTKDPEYFTHTDGLG